MDRSETYQTGKQVVISQGGGRRVAVHPHFFASGGENVRWWLRDCFIACLLLGVYGLLWADLGRAECVPGEWYNNPEWGEETISIPKGVPFPPSMFPVQTGWQSGFCPAGTYLEFFKIETDGCWSPGDGNYWLSGPTFFLVGTASGGCGANVRGYDIYYNCVTKPANPDWDCDGIPDDEDPDPGHGIQDSDQDGIADEDDPWPNDGDCPLGTQWRRMGSMIRESDGCVTSFYESHDPGCPSYMSGSCGFDPNNYNPADYTYNETYWPDDSTGWTDWDEVPGNDTGGGGGEPDPQTGDPNLAGILQAVTRTATNTAAVSNKMDTSLMKLDDIYDRLASTSGSQVSAIEALGGKLDQIKGSIDGLDLEVNVNMTGVEGRLDTANTTLGEIKEKIPGLGSEALPDGNTTEIQDNSAVSDENNLVKLNAARDYLDSVLDWWLSNNPFNAVINDISVSASGSSSMTFNWGKYGTSQGSGAQYQGFLDVLGVAMVALASLMGLVAILRD